METDIAVGLLSAGTTFAGTILGWVLNNLSNRGKLNIYTSSWDDEFKKDNAGETNPAKKKSEVEYYQFNGAIDIYNSSGETKIMREVEIAFYSGRTLLKTMTPLDDSTKRLTGQYIPVHYDELGVLNIPPKSVVSIYIHNGMWDRDGKEGKLDFLWKTTVIKIQYRNEKNRKKTKKVKKVDFLNHFNNQNTEDEDNG